MSDIIRAWQILVDDHHIRQFGKRSLAEKGTKLAEEAGEVCRAIIRGLEGRSEGSAEDIANECGDVFITLLSILAGVDKDAGDQFKDSVMSFLNREWPEIKKRASVDLEEKPVDSRSDRRPLYPRPSLHNDTVID